MLVIEKIFKIKVNENSLIEELCKLLSKNHCFDMKNYEVNDSLDCSECLFFNIEGRCETKIYNWLLSEYEEGVNDENN